MTLQRRAAWRIGRLVANGELSQASANRVLGVIVRVARENGAGEMERLQLVWAAREARHVREIERRNAETSVRWAVRPLLRAKATPSEIEEAARRAGPSLSDSDLRRILAEEWDQAHGRRRK